MTNSELIGVLYLVLIVLGVSFMVQVLSLLGSIAQSLKTLCKISSAQRVVPPALPPPLPSP